MKRDQMLQIFLRPSRPTNPERPTPKRTGTSGGGNGTSPAHKSQPVQRQKTAA